MSQILISNINLIILSFLLFIFMAMGAVVAIRIYFARKRSYFIEKFSDYRAVLEFHMEKAFLMIHKDRILVYSLDAVKLDDAKFNAASQDFVNLLIKMLGPMLYKEFVFLYGDIDTFSFNVLEYFNTRYEDDEIRKASIENLAEADQV